MKHLDRYGLACLADHEADLRAEQTPETRELAIASRVWTQIVPPWREPDPELRLVQIRVVLYRLEVNRHKLAGWIGLHSVPYARNVDELLLKMPHPLLMALCDALACPDFAAEVEACRPAAPCPAPKPSPMPQIGSRFD